MIHNLCPFLTIYHRLGMLPQILQQSSSTGWYSINMEFANESNICEEWPFLDKGILINHHIHIIYIYILFIYLCVCVIQPAIHLFYCRKHLNDRTIPYYHILSPLCLIHVPYFWHSDYLTGNRFLQFQLMLMIYTSWTLRLPLSPRIVYWNLRSSEAHGRVPTRSTEKGVVMLSGLSQGLLKSFLQRKLLGQKSCLLIKFGKHHEVDEKDSQLNW